MKIIISDFVISNKIKFKNKNCINVNTFWCFWKKNWESKRNYKMQIWIYMLSNRHLAHYKTNKNVFTKLDFKKEQFSLKWWHLDTTKFKRKCILQYIIICQKKIYIGTEIKSMYTLLKLITANVVLLSLEESYLNKKINYVKKNLKITINNYKNCKNKKKTT